MAIDKRLQDAINRQVNRELWSAYLYLSMATYFDYKGLGGFASRMKEQKEDESAKKVLNKIKKAGNNLEGLNRDLGKR